MNLKQKLNKFWSKLKANRRHIVPACVAALVISGFQYAASHWAPGWGSYFVTAPAVLAIIVTCVARLDDIGLEQRAANWQARRLGLILTAVGCIYLLLGPFSEDVIFPGWIGGMIAWGVTLTWVTTPNMVPWWKFITGEYRTRKNESKPK